MEKKMSKKKGKRTSLLFLFIELILTLALFLVVVYSTYLNLQKNTDEYTNTVEDKYQNIKNSYVSIFETMVIMIKEEIKSDPSADDMQAWLRSHEEEFGALVGEDYDGIAVLYKGKYAHSWTYSDEQEAKYNDYDPNTRAWYQLAVQSKGKVAILPPSGSFQGGYNWSIVQQLSDTIAVDLDLKIKEINNIIYPKVFNYDGDLSIVFNEKGSILATNNTVYLYHNVFEKDVSESPVTDSFYANIQKASHNLNQLLTARINGKNVFIYMSKDELSNYYVVILPYLELLVDRFKWIFLIFLILLIAEVIVYFKYQKIMKGMNDRDLKITEIANIGFSHHLRVNLSTLNCTYDENMKTLVKGKKNYQEIYKMFLSTVPYSKDKNLTKELLDIPSLNNMSESDMKVGTIISNFAYPDNYMKTSYLKFTIFISQNQKSREAVILVNNITDQIQGQRRAMESIAYYYSAVIFGNIDTKKLDLIKADPFFVNLLENAVDKETIYEKYATEKVKERYQKIFVGGISFDYIKDKLAKEEGYSFTVEFKDDIWRTIRIIRSSDYNKNHSFIFFMERADEQMHQQNILEKALEKAEKATATRTEFFSKMSHDIRTPMNGIVGMLHIAEKQTNPPKTQDCLMKIELSSRYMLSLINNLLDMTKIESGKIELYPEPYLYKEFNEYILSIIQPLCDSKSQNLTIDASTDPICVPIMDKLRINQIIFNLLSNASKYTQCGGNIYLGIKETINEKIMTITMVVRDDGIGMTKEFQKNMFAPYIQERRIINDNEQSSSSGLGLSIVKNLVDLMKGTIDVISEINEGTEYTIKLDVPYIKYNNLKEIQRLKVNDDIKKKFAGKRVLLLEDNRLNQEIAKIILNELGIIVDVANDGTEGINIFMSTNKYHYDWILMDIRMPNKDGYETTKAIREIDNEYAKEIPIIAMSADAFEKDIQKCRQVGMNGHIAKPINEKRLIEELSKNMISKPTDK